MQTLPEEKKKAECNCTLEQRMANLGAKLDRMIEKAEQAQADVQERGSAALFEVKTALIKIREDFGEIWDTARAAGERVSEKLLKKQSEAKESESAPCEPPCPLHGEGTDELTPSDQNKPIA